MVVGSGLAVLNMGEGELDEEDDDGGRVVIPGLHTTRCVRLGTCGKEAPIALALFVSERLGV